MNNSILAFQGDILIGLAAVVVMLLAIFVWVFTADNIRFKSNKKDLKGRWIAEGDNLNVTIIRDGNTSAYKARVFKDHSDNGKFKVIIFGIAEKDQDQIILLDDLRSDLVEIVV
jgi:hypothetical protein